VVDRRRLFATTAEILFFRAVYKELFATQRAFVFTSTEASGVKFAFEIFRRFIWDAASFFGSSEYPSRSSSSFSCLLDREAEMTMVSDEALASELSSSATESFSSAINWGPILAGALTAAAVTVILMLLGSGFGLTMVSPWTADSVSVTTFAASTAVWLVVVQWLSAGLGGYLTGRLRTKWVGIHTDETFFRDTAHGFLAWALATLLVAFVLGSSLSAAVGTGIQAASTVASGAAMGASSGATANGNGIENNATSYFVDSLFRPTDPSRLAAPGAEGDAAAAAQAARILVASAAVGEVSADDKAYLARLVAARTGLSEADATARVDAVLAQVEAAKVKAQEVADSARKAGATFALVGALSLVIGAFIASAAAALGGKLRDDEETLFLSSRR
jgi:hypothetical protein